MPAPKLPSVEEFAREFAKDPKKYSSWPLPMLKEMLERMKQVVATTSGGEDVPDTPIDMAIENPKYKWMDATHLHYLGERIADAVHRTKYEGTSEALVVTMPPRHAKSHLCSVWTPFWFLARYPEEHVLLVASEASIAYGWGEKVRRLVEIYGERYGLRLNPKHVARDDWELMSGGGMKCVGAHGVIAGKPAKLFICDDLVKNDEDARSDYQREKMWDWWDGTALQRVEPDTTLIVIGTRYHEDDIIGRILRASANQTGHRFDLVTLPAKAYDEDPIGRAKDEGLWLDHVLSSGKTWGQSYYDRIQTTRSPYVWNSVYQQTPTAPEGNMVDPAWWRFYYRHQLPKEFDQECQSWDLSLDAQKKTDSRHAGVVLSRRGALIYVRDGFARHCQMGDVETTIRTWSQIFPRALTKLIERATAGPALAQTLGVQVNGILPWPPKGIQKGSKEACLNAVVPAIRAGNVLLPLNDDGTQPRWVQELIAEHSQFPRGQYDDFVDAMSQGLGFVIPGIWDTVNKDQDEAARQQEYRSPDERHQQMLERIMQGAAGEHLQRQYADHIDPNSNVLPFGRGTGTGGMW